VDEMLRELKAFPLMDGFRGRPKADIEAATRAIAALAEALGLHTVAEGIETAAQRDGLLELGCDAGQGWLWTGPQELDKFRAWLAERGT
jgi:EAL domain-containing protein (putative c-di-GMP-specific phosphodiesterase class I)